MKKINHFLLAVTFAALLVVPTRAASIPAETAPRAVPAIVTSETPFKDISTNSTYADAALFCYEHGLMLGTAVDTFAPSGEVNRAQVVTVLYRLSGSPNVTGVHFADVRIGSAYWMAARWAVDLDIMYQFDDGAFAPGNVLTRRQLAGVMRHFARTNGKEESNSSHGNMSWAIENGILLPDADGDIRWDSVATRAELAQAVCAYCLM